jgi:serine/threonine-protein kinase RsbW
MKAVFPSEPAAVPEIRRRTERVAQGLSSDARHDLLLAVTEAAANAVQHSGSDRIEVEWDAEGNRILVAIRDQGRFRSPDEPETDGWGLYLIAATADEVSVRPGTAQRPGTEVQLVKRISA